MFIINRGSTVLSRLSMIWQGRSKGGRKRTYEAREGDELMHPKNKSIPFQLEEHFHNISVDQPR